MGGRSGFGAALRIMVLVVAVSVLFFWLIFGEDRQELLLRAVVVSLLLFLAVLLIRYFSLLWLAVLQHLERSVTGGRTDEPPTGDGGWPGVSILVPAYNEGPVLDRALESLRRLDYPEIEVVVIDDGSTDDTLDRARRWETRSTEFEVRVVTQRNGGKASALNLGIGVSRHPYVVAMDADSRLEPGSLRAAIPHFGDPSVGAVAGNVKVENRNSLLTWLQALEYVEGLNMPRRAQGFLATVNIVPGPVGIFRREALEEVDGYDTDTFAEDADLTLKLVTGGWKVFYEEEAVAWTLAPESWLDLVQQRYRWTRGLLQAVGKRKGVLIRPVPDFPLWISTLEMAFEGFVWPVMNVYGHLFFGIAALLFGFVEPLLYWWLLLTTLDFVLALVTVSMEEEDLRMVPLALIYRFFYLLWLDVSKVFAALEEAGGFEMGWGKLRRAEAPAPGRA